MSNDSTKNLGELAKYISIDGTNIKFNGNLTADTQTSGDASTKVATTAFVNSNFAKPASQNFTNCTANLATLGDNSTKLATTQFVVRNGAGMARINEVTAGSFAMTAFESNTLTVVPSSVSSDSGVTVTTITIVSSALVREGTVLKFLNLSSKNLVLNRSGTDVINTSLTTVTLKAGESAELVAGSGNWRVSGGSLAVSLAQGGTSSVSLAANGYEIRPSGVITQWGRGSGGGNNYFTVTFPMAFPNACYNVVVSPTNASFYGNYPTVGALSKTNFLVYNPGTSELNPYIEFTWQAIGS